MATYKAEIKTVPTGGQFTVTTESGSISTARQQIEKLYDPIYIYNLRECRGGGSSSGEDAFCWLYLIAFAVALYVIVEYWWIVVPLGVICLIAWICKQFSND